MRLTGRLPPLGQVRRGRAGQLGDLNVQRLLNARGIQRHPGLVPMGFPHPLKCVAEVLTALTEGAALVDGTGNLFDPPDEPAVRLRFDDRVESLSHASILRLRSECSQAKLACSSGGKAR